MSTPDQDYVFVIQHVNERFDTMPYSIARTWREDQGAEIAIYAMYDAVELLKADTVAERDDLREVLDALLAAGVSIYACGFCSRACQLSQESYYPGVEVANRHIFHSLMTERRAFYW